MQINDLWYTPPEIMKVVNEFFQLGFFDPAPTDPDFNGLDADTWGMYAFINPPYSRKLKKAFIAHGTKLLEERMLHEEHTNYLWLVNYGNTQDIKDLLKHASAVCIPEKRIKFIPGHPSLGDGKSPRYDSIFILWGDKNVDWFKEIFSKVGKVMKCQT